MDQLNPNDIDNVNVIKNSEPKEYRIVTKKQPKTASIKKYEKDGDVKTIMPASRKKAAVAVILTKMKEKTNKEKQHDADGAVEITTKLKNGYEIGYETSNSSEKIKR